jgi:hypothetical protein
LTISEYKLDLFVAFFEYTNERLYGTALIGFKSPRFWGRGCPPKLSIGGPFIIRVVCAILKSVVATSYKRK